MRVERAVASGARHCTPHTATGAGAMAEESSRTAAGGMDHAGVVQSLDERLETSRPLERDEVGGTRADVSMPEMPAEDPVKDLLTRKESELMALRSRRVSDLESRVERGATELAELRSRMHQLREDFQYNLNLLDERDGELERYDAQFARAATEAEDAARQVREARLAAQEAVSEARRWQQRASESEAHHARRVAEMRDAVERERFNRDESLLRQREEFDAHKRALMRQIAERDELLETAQSDARDAVAAEARRAREGVDVEKHDADAEASARKAEKEALERRVEEARRRAAAEQEAEARARRRRRPNAPPRRRGARPRRRSARETPSWPRCERSWRRPSARRAPVRGRRRGGGGGGGGGAAGRGGGRGRAPGGRGGRAQARRRVRRGERGARRSRRRARDARGRSGARPGGDARRRARHAPRARGAFRRVILRGSRPRPSRAPDALVNAERALAEKEDAVAAKRHAERALAAAGARETSLAEQMARLRFESAPRTPRWRRRTNARTPRRAPPPRRAPSPSTREANLRCGARGRRRARGAARRALREPGGEAGGRRGGGARGGGVARRGAGRARGARRA